MIVDLVYGQRAGWDLLARLTRELATQGIQILLTSTDPFLLERAAADPEQFGTNRNLVVPFDIIDLTREVSELVRLA